MPYAEAIRVRLNGELGPKGSAWEQFSYGFMVQRTLDSPRPPDVPGLDAGAAMLVFVAPLITGLVTALHGDAITGISSTARLTEVAVSLVGPDQVGGGISGNKLVQRGETIRTPRDQVGGRVVQDGTCPAPQVSLAVSLHTGARGPGRRGRFYLPLPVAPARADTGLIDQALAAATARRVRLLIGDLADGGLRMVVNSRSQGAHPVTEVRVGRALDTIRTRREDLPESYVSA